VDLGEVCAAMALTFLPQLAANRIAAAR